MKRLTEHDENYDGVKYKLRHFNKFKVLLIVTVIFLLLSILFIILFAVEKSKDRETGSEPGKPPSFRTYCGTKACLYASLGKVWLSSGFIVYSL